MIKKKKKLWICTPIHLQNRLREQDFLNCLLRSDSIIYIISNETEHILEILFDLVSNFNTRTLKK